MQNVLCCEVRALPDFERTDSVSRPMFYDACGGIFLFKLSDINEIGSYSEDSQRCHAGKQTCNMKPDILKYVFMLYR